MKSVLSVGIDEEKYFFAKNIFTAGIFHVIVNSCHAKLAVWQAAWLVISDIG